MKSHYKGNLLLISCYPMCTDYQIQNIFVPKRDLQLRIDQITSSFSKNMIGVHIRRTDNIASIKSSPIDVFVHLMQLEIEKEALKKEKDKGSKERFEAIKKELTELQEKKNILQMKWDLEKGSSNKLNEIKEKIEKV